MRKEKRSKISNVSFYLEKLEKEKQTKPKASRGKEIIQTRTEMNETENRKIIEKVN